MPNKTNIYSPGRIVARAALLLCLLVCSAFIQQNDPVVLSIASKNNAAYLDNIGNTYVIHEDELVKYLANGKFFARYSNLKLGSISAVDATNPLKLVVFYKDFQQILFLDNQLSPNSDVVALEKLGYEQTELVCASANNSFWIYDKRNNELIRFNENSKRITSTGNLKQILARNMVPNYMIEHNGFLYLNSPESGIYVFDIFGAFSKVISVKDLKHFQVSENILYYQKGQQLCSYNYQIFEESCKDLPNNNGLREARYVNGRLLSAYADSVRIQKF